MIFTYKKKPCSAEGCAVKLCSKQVDCKFWCAKHFPAACKAYREKCDREAAADRVAQQEEGL